MINMKKLISTVFALALLGANLAFAAPEVRFDVEDTALPTAEKVSAELTMDPKEYQEKSAKFLIDDEQFRNSRIGDVTGGWDVVKTYESSVYESRPSEFQSDTSTEYELYFSRKFVETSSGILDFQFGATITGGDGVYFSFHDPNGGKVLELLRMDGQYYSLNADGTYEATGISYTAEETTSHLHVRMNLDKDNYTLAMDGKDYGTYALASSEAICEVRYGSTKEAYNVTLTASYAILTHNYLVLERFVNAPEGVLPEYLQSSGAVTTETLFDGTEYTDVKGNVITRKGNTNNGNGASVVLASGANEEIGISGTFEQASGNVVFETYILLPEVLNGAAIVLKSGNTDVFYLTTYQNQFYNPKNEPIKPIIQNLWHIVRFEADTTTGKALVKINGKEIGTYDFKNQADYIDGYKITYRPTTASSTMYVDDLTAFVKWPYPSDYPEKPKKPTSSTDYLISINVCSLWRQGIHYGWDDIAAYPELEPVLGYYDEGTPEVSDWEIKMMTEHGIDYQIFCWYPGENINYPIQHTSMNEAIIDGYFNARYSDQMNFAIMWENTAVSNMPLQDFKDYVIPYWVEYFFKDPRYQKIDNKPIFTLWSSDSKITDGNSNTTNDFELAMNALDQACKDAGFAGCEILRYVQGDDGTPGAGIDGTIGYHWSTTGADYSTQKTLLNSYAAHNNSVPTISVGEDYVGWGMRLYTDSKGNPPRVGVRFGLMNPSHVILNDGKHYFQLLKDVVDNGSPYATRMANKTDTYAKNKMINISTWNEYGEGTYVMPTKRFGFNYLDAIRTAYTNRDNNAFQGTLNSFQKQRINYLYDQNRQLLRPQMMQTLNSNNTYDTTNNAFKLDICGHICDHIIKNPEIKNGELLVPIFPESGILSRMMCTYTWDKNTKVLTIKNADHTVSFKIDSNTAVIDGESVTLANTVTMYDGLPIIPLDVLAEGLGYTVVYYDSGKNAVEKTSKAVVGASIVFNAGDYEIIKNREAGKFEFDVEYDLEGFGSNNVIKHAKNGSLVGDATGNDPNVSSPSFRVSAAENPYVYIRMKWEADTSASTTAMQIFFQTEDSSAFSQENSRLFSMNASSNGEFEEICVDMTKIEDSTNRGGAWTGNITKIRFDPMSSMGTFEIDYIRIGSSAPTLSFHPSADQGFKAKLAPAVYNVGEVNVANYTPQVLDGYPAKFAGWSKTDGGEILSGSFSITENTVLYPVWEHIKITHASFASSPRLGIRFLSLVENATMDEASQYGFIVTREALLDAAGIDKADFKVDSNVMLINGVAYDKQNNIDVVYSTVTDKKAPGVVTDKNRAVTAIITGIRYGYENDNFVVRPYIVVNGKTYYSNAVTKNYNDVLKGQNEVFFPVDSLY